MTNRFNCQFRPFGGAYTSESGRKVVILERFGVLNFDLIERQIFNESFDLRDYESHDARCFIDEQKGMKQLVVEVPRVSNGGVFRKGIPIQ